MADLEIRGKAKPDSLSHVKPIRGAFGDMRAVDLTEARIDQVVSGWLKEERSAGTINRELSLLRQALRLAVERKRMSWTPKLRLLPLHNRREGFFERPQFELLLKHLPADLQDFTRFAYLTGWRKGEIASLEWADVELQAGSSG